MHQIPTQKIYHITIFLVLCHYSYLYPTWRFPERGVPPESSILMGYSNYKPSILGYPHFRKPPYEQLVLRGCEPWGHGGRLALDREDLCPVARAPGHMAGYFLGIWSWIWQWNWQWKINLTINKLGLMTHRIANLSEKTLINNGSLLRNW